jgi:hypothetical protein
MKLSLIKLAACLLPVLSVACGAGEGHVDDPSESEDALTQRQLPNVAAIEFTMTIPGNRNMDGRDRVEMRTIGAKSKVTKIVGGFKKRTARDPIPLCHPGSTRTSMKFYDDKGEVVATGGYTCRMGSIDVPGRDPLRVVVKEAVGDALGEPIVPADVLWGVTKVDINKFAQVGDAPPGEVSVDDKDDIGKVLAAMKVDQQIDPNHSGTRCRPTHSLGFYRKDKQVAFSSYVCHMEEIPSEITAMFTAPNLVEEDGEPLARGGIKINPRKIEDVYAAARRSQR